MECCLQSAWMQEIQRQIALRHSPLPTNHALAWLTPSYYHSSIIYPSSSHSSFTNHNFLLSFPYLPFFLSKTALYGFTVDLSPCCSCSHLSIILRICTLLFIVAYSLDMDTKGKYFGQLFHQHLTEVKIFLTAQLCSLPTECHFLSPSNVLYIGIFFCQCFTFSLNHFHWEPFSSSTPF